MWSIGILVLYIILRLLCFIHDHDRSWWSIYGFHLCIFSPSIVVCSVKRGPGAQEVRCKERLEKIQIQCRDPLETVRASGMPKAKGQKEEPCTCHTIILDDLICFALGPNDLLYNSIDDTTISIMNILLSSTAAIVICHLNYLCLWKGPCCQVPCIELLDVARSCDFSCTPEVRDMAMHLASTFEPKSELCSFFCLWNHTRCSSDALKSLNAGAAWFGLKLVWLAFLILSQHWGTMSIERCIASHSASLKHQETWMSVLLFVYFWCSSQSLAKGCKVPKDAQGP